MTGIVCVVPARGGSKRLPGKNLLPLGREPLVTRTVRVARAAEVFERVVVSSDDTAILALAAAAGAEVAHRPAELSGDDVDSEDVVAALVARSASRAGCDSVAMMLPTCPLRSVGDVRGAVARYRKLPAPASLVAVTAFDFPPQLALRRGDDGLLHPTQPAAYRRTRLSQAFEARYRPTGALYVTTIDRFLTTRSFFEPPLYPFVMPAERAIDVDHAYQLRMAEGLLRGADDEAP